MLMYEIWSLGHKPFEDLTNPKVNVLNNMHLIAKCIIILQPPIHSCYCNNYSICFMQAVEMIRNGVRLSPPPGCPRAIYKLMIQCW